MEISLPSGYVMDDDSLPSLRAMKDIKRVVHSEIFLIKQQKRKESTIKIVIKINKIQIKVERENRFNKRVNQIKRSSGGLFKSILNSILDACNSCLLGL